MLLLKIDPTPNHIGDINTFAASPSTNLLELIQMRRDRANGARQIDRRATVALPRQQNTLRIGDTSEYRDDDLISALDLGNEFLVFVTDDGPAPYLFRIAVEASRIGSFFSGGRAGSGELSVARFAANGVMSWLPLPRAIRSNIHETAAQMGATILGPVEHTELPGGDALQLVLRGDQSIPNRIPSLLSLNLCPPMVGDRKLWQARRYSWSESGISLPEQRGGLAVNDNAVALASIAGPH